MSDTDEKKPAEPVRLSKNGKPLPKNAWKPGVSANPGGRAKLSGVKHFSQAFKDDIFSVWKKEGKRILEKLAKDSPGTFAQLAARLVPQEIAQSVDSKSEVKYTITWASGGQPLPPGPKADWLTGQAERSPELPACAGAARASLPASMGAPKLVQPLPDLHDPTPPPKLWREREDGKWEPLPENKSPIT